MYELNSSTTKFSGKDTILNNFEIAALRGYKFNLLIIMLGP